MLKYQFKWQENQGLGKNNQGALDPIKTQLKFDRRGLGNKSSRPRVTHNNVNKIIDERRMKRKERKTGKTPYQRRLESLQNQVKSRIMHEMLYSDRPLSELQMVTEIQ